VAPRAAVTVSVSLSNRVDLHEWHSTGHLAPEGTICAGYTTGVRKYRALNDRLRELSELYGRAEVLVYLRSIAYLSHA